MRRDFIEHLGPPLERIRVVYNGMDVERFRPGLPSTLRQELGAAPDDGSLQTLKHQIKTDQQSEQGENG